MYSFLRTAFIVISASILCIPQETLFAVTLPSSIANGVFHLDAQDINANGSTLDEPVNGAGISEWGDSFLTNSGSQATAGKKPTYTTNFINGFPALRFNGTSQLLEMIDSYEVNLGISYPEKSFAFLVRTGIDVLSHQVIYEQSVQSKWYSLQIDGGNLYFWVWNTDDWITPDQYKILNLGSISANTNYRIIIAQWASMDGYVNGVLKNSTSGVGLQTAHGQCTFDTGFGCSLFLTGGSIGIGATQNDTIRLSTTTGISSYQSQFFTGSIGEMISWNHTLTTPEVSGIDDYLRLHWGFDTTPPILTNEAIGSGGLIPSGNFTYSFSYTDTGSSIDTGSIDLRIYSWNTGTLSWNTTNLTSSYLSSSTISTNTGIYQFTGLPSGKYRFDRIVSDTEGNTLTTSSTLFIDALEWTIDAPSYPIGDQRTNILGFWSGELLVTVKTVGAAFDISMLRTQDLTFGTGVIGVYSGTTGWGYDLWNGSTFSNTLTAHDTSQTIASNPKNINPNGQKNTYIYRLKYGLIAWSYDSAGDYLGKLKFTINLTY